MVVSVSHLQQAGNNISFSHASALLMVVGGAAGAGAPGRTCSMPVQHLGLVGLPRSTAAPSVSRYHQVLAPKSLGLCREECELLP